MYTLLSAPLLAAAVALTLVGGIDARATGHSLSSSSPFAAHMMKRQAIPDGAVPDSCKSQCSSLVSATNVCAPLDITAQAECFCKSDYLGAYAQCVPCVASANPSILGGETPDSLISALKSSCATLASLSADPAFASATGLLGSASIQPFASETASAASASVSAKVTGAGGGGESASKTAAATGAATTTGGAVTAATTAASAGKTGAADRRVGGLGQGGGLVGMVMLVAGLVVFV